MSLVSFEKELVASIYSFCNTVKERYNYEITEFLHLDKDGNGGKVGVVKVKAQSVKCTYVYQKGKNPGHSCVNNICAESERYCSKHVKYDSNIPKINSLLEGARTLIADAKPVVVRTSISVNSYGNREHKPTGLVFKEYNGVKKVYGRQVGDKVMSLLSSDIEACVLNGFIYLDEAVAEPEKEEPSPDEVLCE